MSKIEETIVSREHGEILNAMTSEQKKAVHAWTLAFAEYIAACVVAPESISDEYEEWCRDD